MVCSDGVWDSLHKLEAAAAARMGDEPVAIAKTVAKAAMNKRGLRDDTTCVCVLLGGNTPILSRESSTGDVERPIGACRVQKSSSRMGKMMSKLGMGSK